MDMIQTFEDARADAKARGWLSYSVFALREIFGLLALPATPRPGRRWTPVAAWGLAGLAAGIAASYLVPAQYTSQAELRLAPAVVNDELVERGPFNVDSTLEMVLPTVFSRTVLTTILNTFDLYRGERQRRPIEDVLVEMRRAIRIERLGRLVIGVAFTYRDRHISQRVTQDLVARLIDENIRRQSNQVFQNMQFFKDRSEEVASQWEKLNAQLRGLSPADPRLDRLNLDLDQARKEYQSLRQKLSDAQVMQELFSRRQGRLLELLDPATLPQEPNISPLMIALAGLACGLGTGLIVVLWRAMRGTSRMLISEPAS